MGKRRLASSASVDVRNLGVSAFEGSITLDGHVDSFAQYWQAREIIESGELGDVQGITIFYGSGNEISGGGCQIAGPISVNCSVA